tara:strand:+ start:72 stop:338 length:267 start_codon:yes stop_codon:yes gene_type:complete
MNEKEVFGEISSKQFEIGDIVEWSTWNIYKNTWDHNYGFVISIKNEIRSNRLVSISTVVPLAGDKAELEHFSLSLRLVSKTSGKDDKN